MAEVIVIMNQKGGVGKTTTAISLAAGFNYAGYNVLAMDIDPQGHLSKFSGAECKERNTILEMIDGRAVFGDTVQQVGYGDIIPADSHLGGYLMQLTLKPSAPFIIKNILKGLQSKYDYVIIDCPPSINQLTISAMVAASKVIVPTEAEYFSVDGVTLIAQTIKEIKECYNPNLRIEGFLLVKYKERLNETKAMAALLKTIAKDYFNTKVFNTCIRSTTAVPASQRCRQSIFDYDLKSTACNDYLELIREIVV